MRISRKLTIPALLLVAGILQATLAGAAMLTTAEMKGVFQDLTCRNAPWPKEELQVDNFAANPASLDLPAGQITYRPINQPHPRYLGRKVLTMAILVDGKDAGVVKMTGDLHLYGEVACAIRRLGRHEKLTKNDIKMIRRNITMLGDDLVRRQTQAVGKRLSTSLQPGDIIRTSHLAEPLLVKRGDLVTIIAQSQGLRATAPGEAKKDGAQGETIRVKNLMSRKYIFAKVIGNGVVRVEF